MRIPSLDLHDPNGIKINHWLREIERRCREREVERLSPLIHLGTDANGL